MKNLKNDPWNKKSCAYAFLVNLLIAAAAFAWTILGQGGLFSLAGDFNSQQIPFVMHASDMLHEGGFWGFDYAVDLGSGFVGSMAFYLLGTPGFWIAQLFPSRYYMYIVGWLYVLKYAAAGLTSYIYISRFVKKPQSALAGSVLYAFSGFMNENLLFYHFHDVVMLFPLLLITLDDLVEKKRRGPFIFAVCINALVNYYFLVGEVIFLVLYYLIRWFIPAFKQYGKTLWNVLFEGILGGVMSMILLWPAFLFVIQNPRVKNDYTGSNSLVYNAQRYLFILKGLLFPAEVMSDHTAVIERNFSSCAAYLPLTGILLVIAYFIYKKKDWLTGVLRASLVIACVPILNAAFSAFAGLYCRWYYMPILLMSAASAVMLDEVFEEEPDSEAIRSVRKAFFITLGMILFFVGFLTLVKWSENEPSLIYRPVLFGVFSGTALLGAFLTMYLICMNRRHGFAAFRVILIIFAVLTTAGNVLSYQCEHGKFSNDLYDEIVTSEGFVTDPAYRIASNDNQITLSHGYAAAGNFCSTVSGSIFRFYEAIGLRRDVKSPDPPDGLHTLVSAKYRIETEETEDRKKAAVSEEAASSARTDFPYTDEEGRTVAGVFEGRFHTYTEYETENIPPIGFTYDSYMTRSEFDRLSEEEKIPYMLRTLVVRDEDEEKAARYLSHFLKSSETPLSRKDISYLGMIRSLEASENFEKTPYYFRSIITSDAPKYAFFSIPNDDGWTAKVNGKEAEILEINGFMAVPVEEGRNEIRFDYETPGKKTGILASFAALLISLLYILADTAVRLMKKSGKKTDRVPAASEGTEEQEICRSPEFTETAEEEREDTKA